tara:strand:- start:569 stop:913 length:345 start_codon:yes stop_codon:yes gene_type:complete
MKNSTIISIIVVLLIFVYWKRKRSERGLPCATLWDDIKNGDAEQIFFETMSLIDNDADINSAMLQVQATTQEPLDFVKCKYAVRYVYEHDTPVPVITLMEGDRIEKCICEKFNV